MKSKLLSIVIPTKNRYETLFKAIETISTISPDEIEIVIQDNSDNNEEIIIFFDSFNYENLIYNYDNRDLSVVDNCNLGVKHSSGKYVCMIGDDDTVLNSIVDAVKLMDMNQIDSLFGTFVKYNWPDVTFLHHKFDNLIIKPSVKSLKKIKLDKELNKCLSHGAQNLFDLPRIYHGIVSKMTLDEVYDKTQSYFPGSSPDMANSIALSLVSKKHVIVPYPIVISGHSYKSTAGQGSRGAHVGNIKQISHLPKDTSEFWDSKIPFIWTAETIYADSAINSLIRMHSEIKINYPAHYAAFLSYNYKLFKILKPYVKSLNFRDNLIFICFLLKFISRRGINFIKNKLETKYKISKNITYSNVNSIEEAFNILNDYNIKLRETK